MVAGGAADDRLHVGVDVVALPGLAVARLVVEGDGHGRVAERIVGRVVARPALEVVGARAAVEEIVTVAAHERVRASSADQCVGTVAADQAVAAGAADHSLDAGGDVVALSVLAVACNAVEGDRHRRLLGRVVGGVGAVAAVEHVVAEALEQPVVARAAAHDVVSGAAV